ncbi:hypothetical protein TWF970_007168 [Orbilia oligospora]|uniref:Uncharacterized protein n=1 Tax=Orbilia oligospora TaxID=2813651 RepID=A0A7C8VD22_ORBOL|nr:hypothetical protein TWF970_007168 [Orbilia oligospora]
MDYCAQLLDYLRRRDHYRRKPTSLTLLSKNHPKDTFSRQPTTFYPFLEISIKTRLNTWILLLIRRVSVKMPIDQITMLVKTSTGGAECTDRVLEMLASKEGVTLAMIIALVMIWTLRMIWRAF